MTTLELDKHEISKKIRQLRQERRWTQASLAKLLGLSQNRLSELERGQGSFTAEQLLAILTTFNVPVDFFSRAKKSNTDQLQNALARFGAEHLLELEALPSETVKDAATAIRETLVSAEYSRYITGIAPVIVKNGRNINLYKLRAELAEAGLERRLGWVLDNTLEAIRHELKRELPREATLAYRKTELLLEPLITSWRKDDAAHKHGHAAEDFLDPEIASQKSVDEVRAESSPISKRWRILTRIQVDDFIRALEAVR
jgi:transcriptional regulator with XRE-family HTH domain